MVPVRAVSPGDEGVTLLVLTSSHRSVTSSSNESDGGPTTIYQSMAHYPEKGNKKGDEINGADGEHPHPEESHKAIGMLGSLAIAVNSLAGPAVLQLPSQYQRSGLIPTTLCLIVVSVLSAYCCLYMAQAVSLVPNNRNFDHVVEFSDVFAYFWNSRAYTITQILFYLCAVCLNVAAIVDTAQVVDSFLGMHAMTVGWNPLTFQFEFWSHNACTRSQVKLGLCEPFVTEGYGDKLYGDYLLTLGYVLTAAVFVPICLMDLKENTAWQILGFAILLSTSIYFCVDLMLDPGFSIRHISLWGFQWSDMVGVIMFNFALVLAIPAWLHEKKPNVSVTTTVVRSTALSTFLYIAVGSIGAMSIPHANVNMLDPMVSGSFGIGMQVAASIFAFFIIGLDIPLFSVLTRYNLTHGSEERPALCSVRAANWAVVYIPWGVSWIFYQGDKIGTLLNWGGVLLTSAIAFVLPLCVAYRALRSVLDGIPTVFPSRHDDTEQGSSWVDTKFPFLGSVLIRHGYSVRADDKSAIPAAAASPLSAMPAECSDGTQPDEIQSEFERSRRVLQGHMRALVVLLVLSVALILWAIGGQLLAAEEYQRYVHSAAYLNGTVFRQSLTDDQAAVQANFTAAYIWALRNVSNGST